jgi:Rps23 Pro-64 3,4-dihydroxylase Tpa1-like proline 4-hydroxylase
MTQKKIKGYTFDKRKGYVRDNLEYITHTEPIPYLLVKNYFDDKDIELMLKELRVLTPKMTYQEPIKMPDGTKQNNQIDLDGIYKDRKISNILNTLDKIYGDSDLVKKLNDMSWFYKVWSYTNLDQSFVAYYEDTDYYKAHRDIAVISIMYWLWEEPKSFTGGNIHLTDYDIEIPLERNQLMIMPSSLNHAVDPIKMIKQTDKLSGMGRYCVVRFLKLK